jgi:hypothetical protein
MGILETTDHTTTSSTTRSLTPAGIESPRKLIWGPYTNCPALSQEQSTTSSWHSCRQTTPPKGGRETTGMIDNVSKTKHVPPPCFSGVFILPFLGGRGKGEYRRSSSSLICRHPVYIMINKMGNNPDRVVVSLKNRKQTNQGYPTGILNDLRDTRSVPWRDPRPEQRPKTVLHHLENMSLRSILYRIQTTIPTLIAQFVLEACIPRDLTIPGHISISVPGTRKLDQGYSIPAIN